MIVVIHSFYSLAIDKLLPKQVNSKVCSGICLVHLSWRTASGCLLVADTTSSVTLWDRENDLLSSLCSSGYLPTYQGLGLFPNRRTPVDSEIPLLTWASHFSASHVQRPFPSCTVKICPACPHCCCWVPFYAPLLWNFGLRINLQSQPARGKRLTDKLPQKAEESLTHPWGAGSLKRVTPPVSELRRLKRGIFLCAVVGCVPNVLERRRLWTVNDYDKYEKQGFAESCLLHSQYPRDILE